MNRMELFNYIEERLNLHSVRIERCAKLNLLDRNMHSENFYAYLLNALFDWNLENQNAFQHNVPGLDLVDKTNRLVIQVSSTVSKSKIEASLGRDLTAYDGWRFKFLSIAKDADGLRKGIFHNPSQLKFEPYTDILDILLILRYVMVADVKKLMTLKEIIRTELKPEIEPVKVESGLATIIKVLSEEDWAQENLAVPRKFSIEDKISHNQLNTAATIIQEHAVLQPRIGNIYKLFDQQGANRSLSILGKIRSLYIKQKILLGSDDVFFMICDQVIEIIQASSNYQPIPIEELDYCVQLLIVDAFIRCKIFESPNGYLYADS